MMVLKVIGTVTVVCLGILHITGVEATDPPGGFEIRDEDNKVLIAPDQIASYDWTTHTLTLRPKVRDEVAKRLPKERIVRGVPFAVTVGGKVLYKGVFTSVLSSASQSVPVIVIDLPTIDTKLDENQLRIQLGYPGADFFKGDDPRGDRRIRDALEQSGKLVQSESAHSRWVVKSLRAMQTINVGMTREELLKVFQEEGGLSNRRQQRFVYRDCIYFKVDVIFEVADNADDLLTKFPKDKIAKISTPFLEWSIED